MKTGSDWQESERRRKHSEMLKAKPCSGGYVGNVHIYVGREAVDKGICPNCGGPAVIHIGYVFADLICADNICWRAFGTLHCG